MRKRSKQRRAKSFPSIDMRRARSLFGGGVQRREFSPWPRSQASVSSVVSCSTEWIRLRTQFSACLSGLLLFLGSISAFCFPNFPVFIWLCTLQPPSQSVVGQSQIFVHGFGKEQESDHAMRNRRKRRKQ